MLNLLLAIFSTCILGILLVSYFFLNSDLDKKQEERNKEERNKNTTSEKSTRAKSRKNVKNGSIGGGTHSNVEEVEETKRLENEEASAGKEVLKQLRDQITRLELELSKENVKVMKLELELKEERMNTQRVIKETMQEFAIRVEQKIVDSMSSSGLKMDLLISQNEQLLKNGSVGLVTSSGSGSESVVTSSAGNGFVEKSDGF
jgi:hypothetical protein